jgi:hypothetical protein
LDRALRLPSITLQADYLGESLRVPLPDRSTTLKVRAPQLPALSSSTPGWLQFDGRNDRIEIASQDLDLPDGPFTVEFKLRAEAFASRQGVVNKTENSEWGFFLNNGTPEFMVYLEGKGYVSATAKKGLLKPGQWHDLAGVFDGKEVRLYVDGVLCASAKGSGKRRMNALPLLIGADVDPRGRGTSWFAGAIDELRISTQSVYDGEGYAPASRLERGAATILLLHGDDLPGPWVRDDSIRARHPQHFGGVRQVPSVQSEPR